MMKLNPGTREGDRQNFLIRPTLMDGADRARKPILRNSAISYR